MKAANSATAGSLATTGDDWRSLARHGGLHGGDWVLSVTGAGCSASRYASARACCGVLFDDASLQAVVEDLGHALVLVGGSSATAYSAVTGHGGRGKSAR